MHSYIAVTDEAVPPGHELNGVSSAIRRPDHSILVANAGAFELTLFDSAGRFQRTIGRKGQGPGEFEGAVAVFDWLSDSVAIYDAGLQRWTILDSALALARTSQAPDSAFRQPTWLYQGAVVNDGLTAPVFEWQVAVLDSVRSRDPDFTRLIRARRDEQGALWVEDAVDKQQWSVYTTSGAPTGMVTLPPGVEPLQIGIDFILGVVQDSLGVEELRVYSLDRPATDQTVATGSPVQLPTDSTILAAFPSVLIAEEMFYAGHAHYTVDPDSLTLTPPFPARLFLLAADARHWSGVAVDPESGATCGLSVGWPAPLGWLEGTPGCGR